MTSSTSTYHKLLGLFFILCFSGSALAEDCFRGTLDKQYCDRDHDLVADLPLDPAEWVNPDTIIFSYTPVEDPAIYAKVWDGFIKHMSEVTGKKVVFFPVQSYAAQYEAMRSGRLHIAGVNTGGNPVAVSCAGLVPFAMMASKDGSTVTRWRLSSPRVAILNLPRTSRDARWHSRHRPQTRATRRHRHCSNRNSDWSRKSISRQHFR